MAKQSNTLATSVALSGLLVWAGCQGANQPSEELLILCGTSFRPPVEKLKAEYEAETGQQVLLSFGGSEDLLPHVQKHAMGDVFVTHDPYMQYTEDHQAMLRWVQVGHLSPVLVVKKGNPKNLRRLEDLTQPGLQVALPNPEFSTCGEMVFALLDKKGIKEAVLQNVGNVRALGFEAVGDLRLGGGFNLFASPTSPSKSSLATATPASCGTEWPITSAMCWIWCACPTSSIDKYASA